MSKFEFLMKKYYLLYIINHKVQKKPMTKEQTKYFPQTKSELRSLIENRIKEEGNEVNLNDIDVSAITDMSELFAYNRDFNGDISSWDVSNVISMNSMFDRCESFNQDLSKWNVSNVTDMMYMFYNCESFNKDISKWDVSSVRYHLAIFYNCPIKDEYKPKFKYI